MGRVKWMSIVAISLAMGCVLSGLFDNYEYAYTLGLAAITLAILSHHES